MHILASFIPGDPYRRGAHRKPADFSGARYMLQVAGLAAVIFLVLAALVGASPLAAQAQTTPAPAVASVTPAQEQAACDAAWELYEHYARHATVTSDAWWWVWRTASHADPEMRHDIHAWMRTGRGWRRVYGINADCTPDA